MSAVFILLAWTYLGVPLSSLSVPSILPCPPFPSCLKIGSSTSLPLLVSRSPFVSRSPIFQVIYTGAILSNNTRKLLRFEISKMLIAFKINKFIVLFIILFGTLSFPMGYHTIKYDTTRWAILTCMLKSWYRPKSAPLLSLPLKVGLPLRLGCLRERISSPNGSARPPNVF